MQACTELKNDAKTNCIQRRTFIIPEQVVQIIIYKGIKGPYTCLQTHPIAPVVEVIILMILIFVFVTTFFDDRFGFAS